MDRDRPKGLPFRLKYYLELVDWTGRAILENKRGYIPEHQPPVLERLQIDPKHWLYMTQHIESRFKGLVGASHALKAACRKLEFQRMPNLGAEMDTPPSGIYVPNLKWSVNQQTSNGVSIMKNSLISIDLAKNVFQICAMDDEQKIVSNKKVSRKKLLHTLSQFEPTTVIMEA
jgi:hypothetical protein